MKLRGLDPRPPSYEEYYEKEWAILVGRIMILFHSSLWRSIKRLEKSRIFRVNLLLALTFSCGGGDRGRVIGKNIYDMVRYF